MPNFERYDNKRAGYMKGGTKVIATLSGDAINPVLNLGARIKNMGFDPNKKYAFLWDAETMELGLEPSETGFTVQVKNNGSKSSISYAIGAVGFCQHFGIRERLQAVFVSELGDTWILKMKKVKTEEN